MKPIQFLGLFFVVFWMACKPNASETPNQDAVPEEISQNERPKPTPPPAEPVNYYLNDSTFIDVKLLDSTVVLDMRYATANNFVEEKMYNCGRCLLRPEVARAVVKLHQELRTQGYGGLKFFDCFRPRPVQQKLWNKVPDPRYVTNPAKGSMHNRGAAVDLTIVDIEGKELEMGTGFDFFGKQAYHTYVEHSDTVQANRDLLKGSMEAAGFGAIRTEWWHYSYKAKGGYPISDFLWDCND
ncbi:MAG: M15 family metallopeptidase [Bacteroidota bacterium]